MQGGRMKEDEFNSYMNDLYEHLYHGGTAARLMNDYFFGNKEITSKEAMIILLPLCKLLNNMFFCFTPDSANDEN